MKRFALGLILLIAALPALTTPAEATWRSRADSLRLTADERFGSADYGAAADLYASAIETFESGAGPSPTPYFASKIARARYLMARSKEFLELYDEAASDYDICLRELPEIQDLLRLRLAACHAGRGDYAAAIAELRVLSDDGNETSYDDEAVLRMAEYYEKSCNLDMALQWYRVYLGRAASYDERALAHLRMGEVHQKRGNESAALASYATTVRDFPRSANAYEAMKAGRVISRSFIDRYSQGLILYNRGRYADAAEFFNWYIRHDQDRSHAHEASYFLGRAQQRLGNFRTAAARYEDAICTGEGGEYFDLAWTKRAYCLRAAGREKESLDTYDQYVRLYPQGNAVADILWEKARYLEEKKRWKEAIATYGDLVARRPQSPRAADARFRSGLCLFKQGRTAEAEALFADLTLWEEGEAEGENEARALFWAAKCRESRSGRSEAESGYLRAFGAAPDSYYGARASARLSHSGIVGDAATFGTSALNAHSSSSPVAPGSGWDAETLEFASWLAGWYDGLYVPVTRTAIARTIRTKPSFMRADTFLALHLRDQALKELDVLEDEVGRDPRALEILIDYCERSGLNRRAIRIAERILAASPAEGFLEAPVHLRKEICPRHFRTEIEAFCAARGISPSVMYSLIRQESLFEPGAVSWVGARGLTQIMPATGSWVANRLGRRGYRRSQLFEPATNIDFGTEYLAVQIADFDGDILRALAAYNGGPEAAARWWDYGGGVDPDLFVEDIGYGQTDEYVRRVYLYSEFYRALYGE